MRRVVNFYSVKTKLIWFIWLTYFARWAYLSLLCFLSLRSSIWLLSVCGVFCLWRVRIEKLCWLILRLCFSLLLGSIVRYLTRYLVDFILFWRILMFWLIASFRNSFISISMRDGGWWRVGLRRRKSFQTRIFSVLSYPKKRLLKAMLGPKNGRSILRVKLIQMVFNTQTT